MVLGIYGAGGLGREILDLANNINNNEKKWNEIVFINDNKNEDYVNKIAVFTFDEFIKKYELSMAKIVIAVGEPRVRGLLRLKVTSAFYKLETLIHPNAYIGSNSIIEEGVIIQYGCFISCNIKIYTNVLIQANSSVGHDSIIENDSVISSYVGISGTCIIGKRVYVGVSVPIKEKITIGNDSIIGMGSVVLRDIEENVVAIGNPARAMKMNDTGKVFK